ncbi:hypothetical protein X474_08445 [Dethiosulfatarculus sandiegensis]|uniref:Yip1 domain-containing protein n=2 Tax=Dethiosulfatarculus sandiegensis TaxID=1429043 RepID=A0A0D2J926_9BACT|nr:hypothetical protein X474_08445 [Dethiosulfatarculus sandiegensis]
MVKIHCPFCGALFKMNQSEKSLFNKKIYCVDCGAELNPEHHILEDKQNDESYRTFGNHIEDLIDYLKLILIKPVSFFKNSEEINKKSAISFLILLYVIGYILDYICFFVFNYLPSANLSPPLWFNIYTYTIITFLRASIVHSLIYYFLRGNPRFWSTAKILCFEQAPRIFLIIPVLEYPIFIWSMILQILGLSEVHKISKVKASFITFIDFGIFIVIRYFISSYLENFLRLRGQLI